MATATVTLAALSTDVRVELCYLARKARLTHPRGRTDNGGRWYPDETAEGGTPNVRTPSRAWPWSYMLACRTRHWSAQLPDATRDADAAVALEAILAGRLQVSDRLATIILG